jgi:hypothetical protein
LLFRSKARSRAGKQRQKSFSEASDGSALIGDEVAAAPEKKLQLGDLLLTWPELAEIRPHTRLIGDEVGIASIGFGLSTVGVAGPIHGEPGDIENFLIAFPQESATNSAAPPPG